MINLLKELIERHKQGEAVGIWSVCSANRFVLEAAFRQAQEDDSLLLIESTSNQVNQYGGYTGMKPADFASLVSELARKLGFPRERLLLGGDHLGPHVWRNEPAATAMEKAAEQVRQYVAAGYRKIHLDTSMFLGDDPGDRKRPLEAALVAERTAFLAGVAEAAAAERSPANEAPLYVIGTEVPIPGGAQEEIAQLAVTAVDEVEETIELTRRAFFAAGLQDAWERVVAVVVQPGVEFADQQVFDYRRSEAAGLKQFIEQVPGLVYEAHSTDYQTAGALRELVEDHFAILKVGPWLTFAFREAVFALAFIEEELARVYSKIQPSRILDMLEQAMEQEPRYWVSHYRGTASEQAFARKYSLSDRIRYYWAQAEVKKALERLLLNLSSLSIPLSLISQFFPAQFPLVREGTLAPQPGDLIRSKIQEVTRVYARATAFQRS